ncbi:MAG TPA: DUF2147 domain-containing protein [Acetobacteraceae bacterium]|nr:DUF2147 domain-containing protein [Acetobacteraceae bacterium]
MATFHDLRALVCGIVASVMLGSLTAHAAETASPFGYWSTADGHGVIEIARCGDDLCGQIVGIDRPANEPMPTDVHGRPQCGLPIITDARPTSDGSWQGRITDPRTGRTYQAKLWLDESGQLHLRGFIGTPLLGRTQVWDRYAGRLTPGCGLA